MQAPHHLTDGRLRAPLLVMGPVRAWAYADSRVTEISVVSPGISSPLPPLEGLEAAYCRPLDVSEIPRTLAFDHDLISPLLDEAARAGVLRIHSLIPETPHFECSESGGSRWADRFTIQRIYATPGKSGGEESAAADIALPEPSSLRILVVANPLGEPALPAMSEEAARVFEELTRTVGHEVDFLQRPLSGPDLSEYAREYDAIFYHGHGRLIDRETVVPVTEGWAPIAPGRGRGVLFFSACLEGGSAFTPRRAGHVVHPVVRLADRVAPFTTAFARTFASADGSIEARVLEAVRGAASADREAGDLRRFIFRLASA